MRSLRAGEIPRVAVLLTAALLLGLGTITQAQDLEPRRWGHLPAGANFAGTGYAFTRGDIYFDPVLGAEDVVLDLHTVAVKYIRTFGLLDHSARIDLAAAYQDARWEGLLQGEPTTVTRRGFADPTVRFAVLLVGGPSLAGAEFAQFRSGHQIETLVGAGMTVHLPLGQYDDQKLLNLGENRFVIRPELGIVHNHRKWSTELSGSVGFLTDNDEFWNGKHREQDPLYLSQGHLIYTFRPGLWAGGSAGYLFGGESRINGTAKDDPKGSLLWALSLGYSFNRSVGVKTSYVGSRTQKSTGMDSNTIAVSFSALF